MASPDPTPAPGGGGGGPAKESFLKQHAFLIGFVAFLLLAKPIQAIIQSAREGSGNGSSFLALIIIVAVFYFAFHHKPADKKKPS
jgi:hypothetical protein